MIAAGEVVERPASVVKELVENAIDAGASLIEVRLEEGGKRLIEVRDDGSGMTPEEACLALERHATSKIATAADLATIRTLGFRGEALPSIAAVSQFTLTTKFRDPKNDGAATRVRVVQGRALIESAGASYGTTVRVEHLFADVPARRKFLKTERTELAYIQDLLTRLALAHPQIRFSLHHGERALLQCTQRGTLLDRMTEIFGHDAREQWWALTNEGAITLRGYCGSPELARSGASQSYLYVNGRMVKDRLLTSAVMEGFRTYIAASANPFVVLMVECAAELVDVNVHPAKHEVRFVNPHAIFSCITHAIKQLLAERKTPLAPIPVPYAPLRIVADRPHTSLQSAARTTALTTTTDVDATPIPPREVHESSTAWQQSSLADQSPQWTAAAQEASIKFLGQFAATYLLYEIDDRLIVIDQHAAHERIGFEELQKAFAEGGVAQQWLALPAIITAAPLEIAAIEQAHEVLAQSGLVIEPFGEQSIAVKAIPAMMMETALETTVHAVMADLLHNNALTSLEAKRDMILATIACHRQIRAGDLIDAPRALALFEQLARGDNKDRCPHGRPTWIAFTHEAFAKWFHRT